MVRRHGQSADDFLDRSSLFDQAHRSPEGLHFHLNRSESTAYFGSPQLVRLLHEPVESAGPQAGL